LAGLGDEDIKRVSEQVKSRLDQADAESEMVTSRLQNQVDEAIGQTEIDLQLEDRRKRLGLGE
jgi:hypothetical protein